MTDMGTKTNGEWSVGEMPFSNGVHVSLNNFFLISLSLSTLPAIVSMTFSRSMRRASRLVGWLVVGWSFAGIHKHSRALLSSYFPETSRPTYTIRETEGGRYSPEQHQQCKQQIEM
jgi:hypothetical protein